MQQRQGACLVVGAGDGLGGAIARAFAADGLAVAVTRRPRHAEALETLAASLRDSGADARAYPLDAREEILDPQEIARNFVFLHRQRRSAWTFEMDLRPFCEPW